MSVVTAWNNHFVGGDRQKLSNSLILTSGLQGENEWNMQLALRTSFFTLNNIISVKKVIIRGKYVTKMLG